MAAELLLNDGVLGVCSMHAHLAFGVRNKQQRNKATELRLTKIEDERM